jgi:hypothetical protein
MNWPSKVDCEIHEIKGFIKYYKKFEHGRKFNVIEIREKPDRIVQDKKQGKNLAYN